VVPAEHHHELALPHRGRGAGLRRPPLLTDAGELGAPPPHHRDLHTAMEAARRWTKGGGGRAGGMGGASLAGSAGEPWIWWWRKQGGEEGERERVVGVGAARWGRGIKNGSGPGWLG
jgi:hypothetical protein